MAEGEAELTEISANEILDKIQKGEPVEYDHIRINGDLDLSELDLPTEHVARTEYQITMLQLLEESKVVSSSVKITNSKFDAKLNFDNILFRGPVYFNNTTFSDAPSREGVGFRGATFSGEADFRRATFSGKAIFHGANFGGDVSFSNTTLSGYVFFREATFSGDGDFRWAAFSEDAYFNRVKFEGDVLTFRNAVFIKPEYQEETCRRAKNVLAKAGNRDEEEYHFYREMDAKR